MLLADAIVVAVMMAVSFLAAVDSGPMRALAYALARRRRHRRMASARLSAVRPPAR